MMKLGSCIEMMFSEFPFIDRIAEAKKAGFSAVEFWGWKGKDLKAISDAAEKAGVAVAACCVDTNDAALASQFGKGAMLVKENASLFAEMAEETMEAVAPLGIRTLIATTGQALPGADRKEQHDAIAHCLRAAAPLLKKRGFTLALEPLNTLVDHKGYFLDSSKEAFEIIREVNSPRVRLLYDAYHMQVMEGNLISTITENIGLIGHIHIADAPGRHEPGSGEINYENVFKAIGASGYAGYVGCEYSPSAGLTTAESARLALSAASYWERE